MQYLPVLLPNHYAVNVCVSLTTQTPPFVCYGASAVVDVHSEAILPRLALPGMRASRLAQLPRLCLTCTTPVIHVRLDRGSDVVGGVELGIAAVVRVHAPAPLPRIAVRAGDTGLAAVPPGVELGGAAARCRGGSVRDGL